MGFFTALLLNITRQTMLLSNPPRLILIAGLPGTGKSTVARALVEHYGGLHINSDLLRNALNMRGHYRPDDKEKVYQEMLERSRLGLLNGQSVVVDSTFIRENVRTPFEAVAQSCGVPFFWVEMLANEDSIRQRLEKPRADSEADFSVFLALRAQNEPLQTPHLALWSDKMSLEDLVKSIYDYTLQASL